jgi:hypothetical protein
VPPGRKAFLEGVKHVFLTRQFECQFFITGQIIGNEFRKTGGRKKAGGDPAGKRRTSACKDGNSRQQRVGGGCVGVVRLGVEKKFRRCKPRQMALRFRDI